MASIDTDNEKPSVAAILAPDATTSEAIACLDHAMAARRCARFDDALPSGYHAGQREWLGVLVRHVPEEPTGAVLLPHDVAQVFDVALWLSTAHPERFFVAWRRFRGMAPVVKYFHGGQPQWKEGEDRDLEVHFDVPGQPSAELVIPEDLPLPADLAAATALLDPLARPFPKNRARFPGERIVGYLHRSSPLG